MRNISETFVKPFWNIVKFKHEMFQKGFQKDFRNILNELKKMAKIKNEYIVAFVVDFFC